MPKAMIKSRNVEFGAALLAIVMSGGIKSGNCARLQPTRIKVTCPIADALAKINFRSHKPINADTAKMLVQIKSSGAHHAVSR